MKLPDNCIVRLIDLPPGVRGFVSIDEDGIANIYINARQSYDVRRKTLRHEVRHVLRDDAFNALSLSEVEADR